MNGFRRMLDMLALVRVAGTARAEIPMPMAKPE